MKEVISIKKLSIEEKAKAYDKIIEKANKMHNENCEACQMCIEELILELKESDDEKMRKELIRAFKSLNTIDVWNGIKRSNIITWLEKQDEQKLPIEKLPSEMKRIGENLGFQLNKIVSDIIKLFQTPLCLMINDEQKSADKIEPNFKVGDWAVSNLDKKARQISEVHFDEYNSYYVVNGKSVNLEEYDRLHHLWTIQDAKDGDVLVSNQIIILFKSFEEDSDWNFVIAYAGIDVSGKIQITNEHWLISNKTKPATKEQRDLLFQKMKEAGYEWDAENKQLRKIEQKTATWSEEDEKMSRSLHNIIYVVRDCDCNSMKKEELSDWLESLKDRIQSQQKQE